MSSLGKQFSALLSSDRTSPQTRAVLTERLTDPRRTELHVFTAGERLILDALCARVLPGRSFDLASRIERWLDEAKHDGWRDARLPRDREAWQIGLRTLDAAAGSAHHARFADLEGDQQDALLLQAREKTLKVIAVSNSGECAPGYFDAEQMGAWFEDVRGELAKIYMADPLTMEQVGFTGFADEQGFTQIRLGEFEEFER